MNKWTGTNFDETCTRLKVISWISCSTVSYKVCSCISLTFTKTNNGTKKSWFQYFGISPSQVSIFMSQPCSRSLRLGVQLQKSTFINFAKRNTVPAPNIAPENRPSRKETGIATIHFRCYVSFREGKTSSQPYGTMSSDHNISQNAPCVEYLPTFGLKCMAN